MGLHCKQVAQRVVLAVLLGDLPQDPLLNGLEW
jgi:hypothetical protein